MNQHTISKQKLNKLHATALFNELSNADFNNIINDNDCFLRSFNKGDNIYQDKELIRCLSYICKGVVTIRSQSSVYLMKQIKQNSFFGVANLFSDKEEYVSEIEANSDTKIIFFKESLIKKCLNDYPTFTSNYVSFLTDRIRYLNNKINIITNGSNTNKVIAYLLKDKKEDIVEVEDSYTKLAKRLDMSRASLYRSLDELEVKGIIDRVGKVIRIINSDIFL